MSYVLDLQTNTIHKENCRLICGNVVIWKELYLRMIGKGKKCVCAKCCRADYRALIKKKNEESISKANFLFIAVRGREVFHLPTCKVAVSAKEIQGFTKYKYAIKKHRPCALCKPKNEESEKPLSRAEKPKKKNTVSLPKEEVKALKRYMEAKAEFENESFARTQDAYTLVQTQYVFWVSRGYKNFHLRNCPKLKGLQDLKGFGKYSDALRAGYTPCKNCKPTKKDNVDFSIPLRGGKVLGETADILTTFCQKKGYECTSDESFFYITTPKGQWKIHVKTNPIRLEHINLLYKSREYHRQPRLFLSFKDVFEYIKRHDS